MDPASLALSIVPLVVGSLRAYKAAYEHLHTLRHYSKEVRKICRQLGVQHCLFTSEVQLILVQALRCPSDAPEMLAEPSHDHWKDSTLDTRIKSCLGKDSKAYYELIESIKDQLEQLQIDMSCFDALLSQQLPGERMKHTIDRLKSVVRITFDKRRYAERIHSLRHDNEDLRNIGSYICRSQPDANDRKLVVYPPSELARVRGACLALHDSLTECWTCSDPNAAHDSHVAKLCLEAQVSASVQLNLALACKSRLVNPGGPAPTGPMWTWMRTLTSAADRTSLPTALDDECQQTLSGVSQLATKPYSRPKKRLKLNLARQASSISRCNLTNEQANGCGCKMRKSSCLRAVTNPEISDKNARQLWSHDCRTQSTWLPNMQVVTVSEDLGHRDSDFSMPDQLKLAIDLATAVLCFRSTPWLHDQWRTTDISWFRRSGEGQGTLHVTTNIVPSARSISEDKCMSNAISQDSTSSDEWRNAQYLYGVPNAILFSLGIALLEVAHRQPLESFRLDRDPNNIFTARRLAQRPSVFGPKYQRLTQRCLQCDFGQGSDLEQSALQGAVYHDVVEQLGDMLAGFELWSS